MTPAQMMLSINDAPHIDPEHKDVRHNGTKHHETPQKQ
jgi:hypothetical protein